MLTKPEKKFCQTCNAEIRGRIDKKFCDDLCRTTFNNAHNVQPAIVKEILQLLKRNRKILADLTPDDTQKTKVSFQKLIDKGFNFMYHTHTHHAKNGAMFHFCFDYGYQKTDENTYLIIKRVIDY